MNIYVLDTNPAAAAKFHNDTHVYMMIREAAHILSSAHIMLDGQATAALRVPLLLQPPRINHRCALWVRESSGNYTWLHSLMTFLLVEYRGRYGRHHPYSGEGGLWLQLDQKPLNMPMGSRTPWPLCIPPRYHRSDPVLSYRLYYFGEKQKLAVWSKPARKPDWWIELQELQVSMPDRAPDTFRSYA